MVTVYSKPGCQPCRLTTQTLDAKGIEFEVKDVTEDPEAEATVRSLGYLGVPVVVVSPTDHWQGLRPDRLATLS